MRHKFKTLIFLIGFLISILPLGAFASAEAVKIDTDGIDSGVVTVAYQSSNSKNIKVMIEKGNNKYTYDLTSEGSKENFPLQMGNGDYKVSVLENISGNRYSYLKTKTVNLKLNDEDSLFLNSIQNINWNHNGAAAKKAAQLTKDLKDDKTKVEAIYNYIVKNFSYDFAKLTNLQPGYVPDIEDTLNAKKGICYDYASLFASMTRSLGIPCKLIKGYAKNVTGYHAWNEVKLNGKWVVIDTTYDLQVKTKATYTMEKNIKDYQKVCEY